MTRSTVMLATALAVFAVPAQAQTLVTGGQLSLGSGLEAGDPGTGTTAFQRARTRLAAGVDARVDEDLRQGVGIVAFAEIEPHVGLGAELRYLRWLSPYVVAYAGPTGVVAPHTLLGASAGVQLRLPVGPHLHVIFEPSFAALPLGTDLSGDKVLLWGLFSAGLHANL